VGGWACGFQTWPACFEEEKNFLLLSGIKAQFLGCSAHSHHYTNNAIWASSQRQVIITNNF
jgi:hypothetical protein